MTLVGTPNVIETADSSYADYADNFDLSLLSMDNNFNSIVNGRSTLFSFSQFDQVFISIIRIFSY